jgi:IclR family KDG regulon transcriptional repressor
VTISHVGSRIPAHCSALGKAILAQLPDDEVGRRVAGNLQRRMTQRSIGTMDELLADLAETRDRGYALEVGESILGRCCIAVPVPLAEHSREVAGISVSFAGEDPRSPVGEEILEHIRFAAGRLRREAAARTLVDQLQTGSESDVSWPSMPSPG